MRYLVTGIAVCAALALIGASALMNFVFWSEQGRSALEGQIFGGVSVALDILKSLLPLFIAFAVAGRRWIYAALGSTAFTLELTKTGTPVMVSTLMECTFSRGILQPNRPIFPASTVASVNSIGPTENVFASPSGSCTISMFI